MKSNAKESANRTATNETSGAPAPDDLSEEQLDHVAGGSFVHVVVDRLIEAGAGGTLIKGASSGAVKGAGGGGSPG
jgi:hypothetical protein